LLSLRSCLISPSHLLSLALFATAVTISAHAQEKFSSSSDLALVETHAALPAERDAMSSSSAIISGRVPVPAAQQGPRYGGIHEFSIDAGVSRVSGPVWGYRQDVDYEVVHLRYSRLMKSAAHFTAYYSPEITPYAKLDEPVLTNNDTGDVEIGRRHTTGGGVSPIGFTIDALPRHHVQPFWACTAGMIYFRDRVLSPQGSQFMYTIDFGFGMNIYQSRFVSTTIGFRYDHMSNANISFHNPGTDAELWYIGFSRFHSPKNRRNE
jgi:hypothetical protein